MAFLNDDDSDIDDDPYDEVSKNRKFTKADLVDHFNVEESALRCMVSGLNSTDLVHSEKHNHCNPGKYCN